ncbi:protein LTO1 homolog [Cylas formicarius]|uniref:protein LTO1 homolog n=1 Tax=Cylas formicarius TaxID=197179 RepID=UPI002958992C|nr:protein LTO1 homolog [Cylas formicarius]
MQEQISGVEHEVDINDVFEDILFAEEKIVEQGYQEGYKLGSAENSTEGYHLGYHRGCELGYQLGYYNSFAGYYLAKSNEFSEKIQKNLENLKQLVANFPQTNVEDVDIIETMEKIHSLYKKLCVQLKLTSELKKDSFTF